MTPSAFLSSLKAHQLHFVTGVPDSIFKHVLLDMAQDTEFEHRPVNNEGEACALAAGYYLATAKIPTIYLQNSGFGNCINPLTSLLDPHIYSIPCVMLITWRGLPGRADEPQHITMGNTLLGLLSLLQIPYWIAQNDAQKTDKILQQATQTAQQQHCPVALVCPNDIITSPAKSGTPTSPPHNTVIRETVLEKLVEHAPSQSVFISTTGKTSRELFEIRERRNENHSYDFLTVGSMGCVASIGLGIALQQTQKNVIIIDGDGACLMRLEALVSVGAYQPKNLVHILLDNNAHESTGGQQTLSHHVDFVALAKACGYQQAVKVDCYEDFVKELHKQSAGPRFIVVKVFPYSRADLGRPTTHPQQNKHAFMQTLQSGD